MSVCNSFVFVTRLADIASSTFHVNFAIAVPSTWMTRLCVVKWATTITSAVFTSFSAKIKESIITPVTILPSSWNDKYNGYFKWKKFTRYSRLAKTLSLWITFVANWANFVALTWSTVFTISTAPKINRVGSFQLRKLYFYQNPVKHFSPKFLLLFGHFYMGTHNLGLKYFQHNLCNAHHVQFSQRVLCRKSTVAKDHCNCKLIGNHLK